MIIWISGGANSAVAAKIALQQWPESVLIRIWMPDEHEDTDRFCADIARWLDRDIITVSSLYPNVTAVAQKMRFILSQQNAPCTDMMKRQVRHYIERYYDGNPLAQVFGFTVDEQKRYARLCEMNPEYRFYAPLIDASLTGEDCRSLLIQSGITLPQAYALGLEHNNCIGCLKARSSRYWSIIKQTYPVVFQERAQLEREIGYALMRTKDGSSCFLDEMELEHVALDEPIRFGCSFFCYDYLERLNP